MFIKDWYNALRCRLVYHPHRLHIHHPELSGWGWRDRDLIILCANFQILMDFVELELPQFSRFCGMSERWEKVFEHIPFSRWFMDSHRNPQAGIDHLRWAMSLGEESVSHAHYASEQLALYLWWTQERPARIDPFDDVPECVGSIRELLWNVENDTPEVAQAKEAYFASLRKAGEIEEAQEQEDEDQLIRLMKVRRGLWT